ncbi:MAG: formyltransferase family protein [Candidatus Paceibacterota bacterium]|jgi:phosphoribosylglycinamide formyltransferase-1
MRIALLISGGGTTMEAIIKATQNGILENVVPALVISSNENAGGIEKAKKLGIKNEDILIINPKNFENREKFGEEIIKECKKRKVNFIGQYGWHWLIPENVINEFKDTIVNQHPGPLDNGRPDFGGAGMYGLRVHQARLLFVRKVNRDFWTEATAHRVTVKFDKGQILKRKQVPILEGDTAESLQARVLPIEHEVQIETLRDFANNTVSEFIREKPLIYKDEEKILEECKELAKKMYPKG